MNLSEPNYIFASTGGGDKQGFNDSVVTTFKSNDSTYHLARESIQNIIDAKDPNVAGPAKAAFTFINLDKENLPKLERLAEIFRGCMEYASEVEKTEEGVEFYSKAIRKIENDGFIPVLKISDYNTVGLDKENHERLINCVGSSAKSPGAGGSFGLGKGAYFASSNFRTIFVSSIYGNGEYIFQGKLRLSSRIENNDMLQGNGTYGHRNGTTGLDCQLPIRDYSLIPDVFKRNEKGTDIFIIDYSHPDDWKEQMLKSVLNNFWLAIYKGELIVSLDGININKDNLDKIIRETFKDDDIDGKDERGNPLYYYRAYTEAKPENIYKTNLPTLGDVELHLLTDESFPRRVEYFRKTHMVIYKEYLFCSKAYAAVFICENDEGNQLLRNMENTTHDKWSRKSGKDTNEFLIKKKAEAEIELKEFAQAILNKIGGSEEGSSLQVPGLENYLYLPLTDDEFEGDGTSGNEFSGKYSKEETASEIGREDGEPAKVIPSVNPITKVSEETTGMISTGGNDTEIFKPGKHKGGHGKNNVDIEKIMQGDEKILVAVPVKFRSFSIKSGSEYKQIIKIKGPPGKNIMFDLKAGTDQGYEKLRIINATLDKGEPITVENNMLKNVVLGNDGFKTIILSLESKDKYSITLQAYENK